VGAASVGFAGNAQLTGVCTAVIYQSVSPPEVVRVLQQAP
jgi:hypothetical protein